MLIVAKVARELLRKPRRVKACFLFMAEGR
jgi:hypothetical protein